MASIPFYIAQLAILCFAFSMAKFQVPIIKGMRAYWPVNNPYSKPFHTFGRMVGCIVAIPFILFQPDIITKIEIALLSVAWYSLVFDITIGAGVYDNAFYLGHTSRFDAKEASVLGKKAGLWKAIICIVVILVLNALYLYLK